MLSRKFYSVLSAAEVLVCDVIIYFASLRELCLEDQGVRSECALSKEFVRPYINLCG